MTPALNLTYAIMPSTCDLVLILPVATLGLSGGSGRISFLVVDGHESPASFYVSRPFLTPRWHRKVGFVCFQSQRSTDI